MASQGPNSAGTGANDAAIGTVAWSNPSNITSSDDVRATTGSLIGSKVTNYLKGTNFGFSIPSGATIDGILVELEIARGGAGSTVIDQTVKIVKSDGSIGSTNKGSSTFLTTTDSYFSYGGSSDLWGETWAYTDINDIDFGVVMSMKGGAPSKGASSSGRGDHFRITVYYTAGSTQNSNFFQFMKMV